MLQYLVILLDDTSTSYCHYSVNKKEPRLISLDHLRRGIRYGMVENLMIQFVYPPQALPQEYLDVIHTIDHSNIKPLDALDSDIDVVVVDDWDYDLEALRDAVVVVRTSWAALHEHHGQLKALLATVQRLNVVITDVERMSDADREQYKAVLASVSRDLESLYLDGKSPQLNLLTDRMMLTEMNNCGAGDTTVTLAPNGKFYICPAFYNENEDDSVGDLEHGLNIKNPQLNKPEYAPICRHCDAYQCRRCTWLNRKTTLEVNTPGHEQCVAAHLERNASRELLESVRKHGPFLPETKIKELDYLDPFDKREEW